MINRDFNKLYDLWKYFIIRLVVTYLNNKKNHYIVSSVFLLSNQNLRKVIPGESCLVQNSHFINKIYIYVCACVYILKHNFTLANAIYV